MPHDARFQVGGSRTHHVNAGRLSRAIETSLEAEENPERKPSGKMAGSPFAGLRFDHSYRRPVGSFVSL